MKKSILLSVLCALCMSAMVAQNTNTASGKCSNDVQWSFDGHNLRISKSNAKLNVVPMPDYDQKDNIAPWIKQKLAVRKVIIGPGISNIGACAFANCYDLKEVELRDAHMKDIRWGAFYNCRNLFVFPMNANINHIGVIAFANCSSLPSVILPSNATVDEQAFMSCPKINMIEIGKDTRLGKGVFVTPVKDENGKTTGYTFYEGEIKSLPRYINTGNCTEYGLSVKSVELCLEKSTAIVNKEYVSDIDTDLPQATIFRNDTYALIIGNENYMNNTEAVPFAHDDANLFAEYCRQTLGIPLGNIRVSLDATKYMIRELLLDEWIGGISDRKTKKLIVYYAGHGVPDLNDENKPYLLPIDVPGSKPNHGISLEDFYKILGEYGFERVTVFIDACFSGINRTNKSVVPGRAVGVVAKEAIPVVGNLVVIAAAHGNETAQNYHKKGHGLFTYYLLKEIKDSQGMITYGKLAKDIQKDVSETAPTLEQNIEQTPEVSTSIKTDKWKDFSF